MRAKDKMQKLDIEYIDVNLDIYPERRAEAKERSGRNTVPQIFFNQKHIGGFDDFDKLVRRCAVPFVKFRGSCLEFLLSCSEQGENVSACLSKHGCVGCLNTEKLAVVKLLVSIGNMLELRVILWFSWNIVQSMSQFITNISNRMLCLVTCL